MTPPPFTQPSIFNHSNRHVQKQKPANYLIYKQQKLYHPIHFNQNSSTARSVHNSQGGTDSQRSNESRTQQPREQIARRNGQPSHEIHALPPEITPHEAQNRLDDQQIYPEIQHPTRSISPNQSVNLSNNIELDSNLSSESEPELISQLLLLPSSPGPTDKIPFKKLSSDSVTRQGLVGNPDLVNQQRSNDSETQHSGMQDLDKDSSSGIRLKQEFQIRVDELEEEDDQEVNDQDGDDQDVDDQEFDGEKVDDQEFDGEELDCQEVDDQEVHDQKVDDQQIDQLDEDDQLIQQEEEKEAKLIINQLGAQLEEHANEDQLEESSDDYQLRDNNLLEERRDENQLEEGADENQLEERRDESQLEEHRDENQLEEHSDENQLEECRDENQLEERRDENQPEELRDEDQLEEHSDENKLEECRDENQLEERRDENQRDHRRDENQLKERGYKNPLQESDYENQPDERVDENRLKERGHESQLNQPESMVQDSSKSSTSDSSEPRIFFRQKRKKRTSRRKKKSMYVVSNEEDEYNDRFGPDLAPSSSTCQFPHGPRRLQQNPTPKSIVKNVTALPLSATTSNHGHFSNFDRLNFQQTLDLLEQLDSGQFVLSHSS